MTELSILLVEDDELQRKSLFDTLTGWGHDVLACDCLADARKLIGKGSFDMALLDMQLPDGNGLDLLREAKEDGLSTSMVVITAFADVSTAIDSIKSGAYDYLPKPFEPEQLEKIVRNISGKAELSRRVNQLSRLTVGSYEDTWQLDSMIGAASLRPVFEKAQRVAQLPDVTVLILGESGTGKGMLAKAIHRLSARADKPFVEINCSAIPGQLIESEVFGHEKGAFTDAKASKPGLLEVADGGTVFLDEIGDMELNLQAKLLKVIEEKTFRRVGSSRETKVDIRILAATNRDLKARAAEGKFREDLYYRLAVVPIELPPLREHPESIRPLAEYYLQLFCRQQSGKPKRLSNEAIDAMAQYPWPGNIRELRHAVERSAIFTSGDVIGAADLVLDRIDASVSPVKRTPSATTDTPAPCSLSAPLLSDESEVVDEERAVPMSLAAAEKRLIQSVLDSTSGNKNRAAEILEIHRTTLYKKIEQYGLQA